MKSYAFTKAHNVDLRCAEHAGRSGKTRVAVAVQGEFKP